MAKLAEVATQVDKIRAPLDWQRQVELWGDRKLLHDMMMYGNQHLEGRTEAQGWVHEHPQATSMGPRRHDTAKVVRRAGIPIVQKTTEYKAGWVSKKEGLRQLYKEREILTRGLTQDVSEYVIRAEHPPHPAVLREAQQMEKDFPGKFKLIKMSEREFERAVEAGRPIAHAKAVERLGYLIEKVRQSPELTTAPRAIEGLIQEIEKGKQRGEPIGLHVLVGARVELAQLLEADCRITQEADKVAREAAHLRLKEAQIVEHVQAQRREERRDRLSQMVARVDREIVASAVTAVRPPNPAKSPERAQLLELAGNDPTMIAMAKAMENARAEMQRRVNTERAPLEREALAKLALPTPMHHEVAQLVLEQQRDNPGPITVERVQAAEREVQARAREAQARETRERENREVMERVADAYNKRLEQAAREQGTPRGIDKSEDAAAARQAARLAKDLRMDPNRLIEKGVDARAVDELVRGNATTDAAARAYVVQVSDRTMHIGQESQEVAIAKQIRMVEMGLSLDNVEARVLREQGHATTSVAKSRADLERQREEAGAEAAARSRAARLRADSR
ncbi:hypothetical protein [Nocardia sp. MW-W600-9]